MSGAGFIDTLRSESAAYWERLEKWNDKVCMWFIVNPILVAGRIVWLLGALVIVGMGRVVDSVKRISTSRPNNDKPDPDTDNEPGGDAP